MRPWIALLVTIGCYELPALVAPDRLDLARADIPGDLLVLWTVWHFAGKRFGRALGPAIGAAGLLLFAFRIDEAALRVLTRAPPVLYDQWFLLRHVPVLVLDLGPWAVLGAVALVIGVAGAASGLVAAMRAAAAPDAGSRRRLAAAWLLSASLGTVGALAGREPRVRFTALGLAGSLAESVQPARITSPPDPVAAAAVSTRPPSARPDVFLFFVESYGRVLAEDPHLRAAWVPGLAELERRLDAAGVDAVSSWSTAPVSGGRSWLAAGSTLAGRTFRYEADFRRFLAGGSRRGTLPDALARLGYRTVLLAPADRARLGVAPDNPFGFDRYLSGVALDYRGPRHGWGVIPDQYSLHRVEAVELRPEAQETKPVFLHFHMVSSHALWQDVPAFEASGSAPALAEPARPRVHCAGALFGSLCEGYLASIQYDLRVVEEFVVTRRRDFLVVVLGDHQPPAITPEDASFDVPVHVLARDPSLLAAFSQSGFSPGLLPERAHATTTHAGLSSLVLRALAEQAPAAPSPGANALR